MPELLGDDHLLFPPDDAAAAAERVLGLLDGRGRVRPDITAAWRERASAYRYSWEERITNVAGEVAGGTGRVTVEEGG